MDPMTDREELAARERGSWEAFERAVNTVPASRRDEVGVVPGWTVQQLVWHVVGWVKIAAEQLQEMNGDDWAVPYQGEDDSAWQELNDQLAVEAAAMSWDQVMIAAEVTRDRALEAFANAPDTQAAAEWFAEETFEHYDEHRAEIERWLSSS
jgi:hypothetical protein